MMATEEEEPAGGFDDDDSVPASDEEEDANEDKSRPAEDFGEELESRLKVLLSRFVLLISLAPDDEEEICGASSIATTS